MIARLAGTIFMQTMLDAGISTRRGIMTTHRETAYKTEYAGLSLPVSEKASDRSIILPLYIPMKDEDIEKVIDTFTSLIIINEEIFFYLFPHFAMVMGYHFP